MIDRLRCYLAELERFYAAEQWPLPWWVGLLRRVLKEEVMLAVVWIVVILIGIALWLCADQGVEHAPQPGHGYAGWQQSKPSRKWWL